MSTLSFFAQTALLDGAPHHAVRITAAEGRISALETDAAPRAGDAMLGLVMPGAVNAHSHAFHRLLRGRTHDGGGDFWRWREAMYAASATLDPDALHRVARAVYGEMLAAGWTTVGEFHYLHHRPGGAPYAPPHAMELALAAAAREVGIRLTLLDTCYLAGGIGDAPEPAQERFSDGTAAAWLSRWHALRDALDDDVVLGAAVHSVRAVPAGAIAELVGGLPAEVPLHVHLSEQPQENADCLDAYGLTPTGLLDRLGALTPRLGVVHATHLTDADIALLGDAGVSVIACPTTEADLGDGIGPMRRLVDAGARLALGTDQHAVIDPFLEARALESGERLAALRRGVFRPGELMRALTAGGAAALGREGGLRVGAPCDLVEVDAASARTRGADPGQLPLVATAADVRRVIVGGAVRAEGGIVVSPDGTRRDPADLLADALTVAAPERS